MHAEPATRSVTAVRPRAFGKFLSLGDDRFIVKGVTYGTFAPDANGYKMPPAAQVARDFALMAQAGFNTIRAYSLPSPELLDLAADAGLRLMIGFEWPQHVAFLDDRSLRAKIRRDIATKVRELAGHPAVLMFVLGNEIPPPVVRWHGPKRIERFLRTLYDDAKASAPDALCTYVNYPPTEYLELPFFDVCSFNVYLHQQANLGAYLARLQHIAGSKPLLLAEVGADSIRNGEEKQAALTSMGLRTAFTEGACGAVVFTWTDAWWRGGSWVDDWAFGLVDKERRPKLALNAAQKVFASAPFRTEEQSRSPKVSVVVCAYNAAATIAPCLASLERLTYPNYEIILVNDGSTDGTGELAHGHERVRVIDVPNGGLSAARNIGLHAATGEIVAYTDADVRADQDWLSYLVRPFMDGDVVGAGGPNVVPADDPWMAQCVARAPGGPTHVLFDDRIAEHVPGCNMAFKREALLAIGGFDQVFVRAGDDVDVCWRLQSRGWKLGFAASALVWHLHRRASGLIGANSSGTAKAKRGSAANTPIALSGAVRAGAGGCTVRCRTYGR